MNISILTKKYRLLTLTTALLLLGIGCSHENPQNLEKTDGGKTEGEEAADETTTEVLGSGETPSSSASATASTGTTATVSTDTTIASTSTLSSGTSSTPSSDTSSGSFCPSNFIYSCLVKGTQPETNTEEACRAVYGVPTCKPASASITYCPSGMILYCPSAYADKMPTAPTFQACYAALSTNTYANCQEPQDIRSTSCVSDGTHKLCVGYVRPATTTTTSTTSSSTTISTAPTTSPTSTPTDTPTSPSPSPGSQGKGKK